MKMSHEQNNPNANANYFEHAGTVGEVLSQYTSLLTDACNAHSKLLGKVAHAHQEQFEHELKHPGSINIDQAVAITAMAVSAAARPIEATVYNILDQTSQLFPPLLTTHDQNILQKVAQETGTYRA